MKTKIIASLISLVVSLLAPLGILVPQASAAVDTCTWTGGGSDNNFSNAANWSGCDNGTVPENGDSLVLDQSILTQNEVLNNDLVGLSLSGISLTNSAFSNTFTISGNSLALTGDITETGTYVLELQVDLTVGSPGIRIQSVISTGSLSIGSNAVTLESANFDGALSGSGTLTLDAPNASGLGGGCDFGTAPASYPFKGNNSGFSGAINLTGYAGLEIPPTATTIARNASAITVGANASLGFIISNNEDSTFDKPITFNGGTVYTRQLPATDSCTTPTTIKTVTLSGAITATQAVVVTLSQANLTLSGAVTGASNFSVLEGSSPAEKLTIGTTVTQSALKTRTYTGDQSSTNISVGENNIVVIDTGASVGVTSLFGGTLKGAGTTGNLSMSSGTVAPGLSPGCLSSGNLNYSGGSLEIEVAGKVACTSYDQQIVVGTVTLGSATTLKTSFLQSFVPALNDSFVIINNDASDAVSGTFTGLAQGATFVVSGVTFQISYTGGDGNDVVLTATAVPATAPNTGIGSIISNPLITLISALFVAGTLVAVRKLNY